MHRRLAGLRRRPCKTDRIDCWVLGELGGLELVRDLFGAGGSYQLTRLGGPHRPRHC